MIGSIEAVGRSTPVNTTPDVSAADGKSGKAEQTAAMKPSLVVTQGAQNKAASAVEKAEAREVRLDERLRHDERTIPVDELLGENSINQIV